MTILGVWKGTKTLSKKNIYNKDLKNIVYWFGLIVIIF